MGRSLLFQDLKRAIKIGIYAKKNHLSIGQGIEQIAQMQASAAQSTVRERETQLTGTALENAAMQLERSYVSPQGERDVKIGIVGAGLAGLACGYELKQQGISATIYEASDRVGGRCYSLGKTFPGAAKFPHQVIERGGELIDSQNKTILRWARQFQLTLEDVSQQPGEFACYLNGQHYTQSAILDEYQAFLAEIAGDLEEISATPTVDCFTSADARFDKINLLEYLEKRQVGDTIKAAMNAAYMAEYGLELEEQSCLNFLLVVRDIETSQASPFQIFSDERYHIVEGNEQIVRGLSQELQGQIELGMRLVRVRKNSTNRIEVTFDNGDRTIDVAYDAVVLAIPFSLLRQVELDANLELPDWKREAINKLDQATHAKMMLGFNGRPWVDRGSSGASYSNLSHHQTTWETNPTGASRDRAILVDFSSGRRGATLDLNRVQTEAHLFLKDLEKVYPGAIAQATRDRAGDLLVHLENWTANPLAQGSYSCYKPGQFTTICGNEGKPVDNLFFAGEHTNSFYEWQGYMEGAALSGIKAASDILQHLKLTILRC
ncbi:amine oxidase [cyanobacterium TDX16]|nr:amine oxidase [cyanobacterium TDX16]